MANIKKIVLGAGWWIIGIIVMYLLNMMMPPTIDALANTIPLAENEILKAIAWIAIIIIMVLVTLIIPIWHVIEGLKEGEQGKFSYILTGIIFWIFALVFIYTQYPVIPRMAAIMGTDTLSIALFWGSTIIIWIAILIGVPGYMIIKGYGQGETTQ